MVKAYKQPGGLFNDIWGLKIIKENNIGSVSKSNNKMIFKKSISFFIILLCTFNVKSQSCTTTGQTPLTAFDICGADTFNQKVLPACNNKPIPANKCGSYTASNGYWNKIECFKTGSLGFLITPKYLVDSISIGDDYNWELFDITGHNPDEVYTDPSLFISANWSGTFGVTGTSTNAKNTLECISNNNETVSPYSIMPIIKQGHTYLLFITHYTNKESMYQLTFSGGSASIAPSVHVFQNAYVQCKGTAILIKLNNKIKCSSLDADGSDFTISSSSSHVISASGINCNHNLVTDSIMLIMDNALLPGNYSVTIKSGKDGNTLLVDNCNETVIVGDSILFSQVPVTMPVTIDSIITGCTSDVWQVKFKKPIVCGSIATNGSDFIITGPSTVIIESANSSCDNNNAGSCILKIKFTCCYFWNLSN